MNETETIFADGIFYEIPVNAPEWVKGKLSVRVSQFIEFLNKHQNEAGYINLDLKVAKSGKAYCSLNVWKPETTSKVTGTPKVELDTIQYPQENINAEDIPF